MECWNNGKMEKWASVFRPEWIQQYLVRGFAEGGTISLKLIISAKKPLSQRSTIPQIGLIARQENYPML